MENFTSVGLSLPTRALPMCGGLLGYNKLVTVDCCCISEKRDLFREHVSFVCVKVYVSFACVASLLCVLRSSMCLKVFRVLVGTFLVCVSKSSVCCRAVPCVTFFVWVLSTSLLCVLWSSASLLYV